MIDTRNSARQSKTFSRSYVAPELQEHLDEGGTVEDWLAGRTPIASMARISADRLKGDAIGVGRQHRNNARNAALHNCAVVVCYEDNNITASKREVVRPAFVQMIKDITHGYEEETRIPLKGCIAVERERVWRLPRDFIALQDALVLNGTGTFIEDKTYLNLVDDDGTIIAGLVTSGTGEAEVRKIRKRTTRNSKDRAEEGAVPGGPRRFGWLGSEKREGRLGNEKKDPAEWPYLIQMIKKRADGRSWRHITGWINRERDKDGNPIFTARGGKWSEQGVKGAVTNPAWWGGRILDGEIVTDPDTGEPRLGKWEYADPEVDKVDYSTWKQIMAGVYANRLHRGMVKPPTEGETTRVGKYLFSGPLRCGRINDMSEVCYSKLSGNKATGKNAKYGDYYRCGDPNCKGVGRRVAPVDKYLTELLLAYLDKHFSGTKPKTIPWRGKEKLDGLVSQRKKIKESVADGEADWSDVHDMLTNLNRNIKTLQKEERDHLQAQSKANLLRGWSRKKWTKMELDEKKEVISLVLASVVVLPVPEERSDKAPFDPNLLQVSWRKKKQATAEDQGQESPPEPAAA
ncbi:Site-specific DNA recombinase [Streptomyces sp. cf386]|uniref:recombinase family protein n=1 Tax=Streptomyces sp. cf386 TaxID=1761904 RepID=UPI0008841A60|nr:recombinase family protein [Streptomyces sp. cf386]SDM63239.1 Site-specific DNA recombinase [Streptomyces sp. cf386]